MSGVELSLSDLERLALLKEDAIKHYRRHEYLESLKKLEDAIKIVPGDLEFLYYQSLCLFQLKQYDRAEELFTSLAELDDMNLLPDVKKMLALTLLRKSKFPEAENVLVSAAREVKEDPHVLNMLGYTFERQNKLVEAERVLQKLVELQPENANGCNSLAYVYVRLEKNLTQALTLIRKALSREPSNAAYLDTLGMLQAKRGNTEDAKRAFKKALEMSPGNREIMNHLTGL